MKDQKSVIIKKVKRHGEGGHHGGSWKVAYADFVTAMMAFFLLLWLVSMVSDEKRARVAHYFKYFSLYESGGTSWMEKSSEIFGESGENKRKVFRSLQGETIENAVTSLPPLSIIGKAIEKDIAEKLGDVKDQVLVDIVDEGIRIQMIDKEGSLMFERGSTNLSSKAKEILKVISADINKLPNKIIIEGHTDSLPYAKNEYSNWELSTERASSARKELEANGLNAQRIARVAGYADTDPFIKENSADPRNRRISITLKNVQKDNKIRVSNKQDEHPLILDEKNIVTIKTDDKPAAIIKKESDTKKKSDKNKTPDISPGPVIKQSDLIKNKWSPAIDNKWDPVVNKSDINDERDTFINKRKSASKAKKDNNDVEDKDIKEIKTDSNLIMNEDWGTIIMKGSDSEVNKDDKSYVAEKTKNNPAIVKDLSDPVISKDDWSPVIKKNNFVPEVKKE